MCKCFSPRATTVPRSAVKRTSQAIARERTLMRREKEREREREKQQQTTATYSHL